MTRTTCLTAPGTLTFMSELASACWACVSRFLALVRSSHRGVPIVLALAVHGCLLQEPPDWDPPRKTRPQLTDPVPSPLEIIAISHPDYDSINGRSRMPIFVNERSEDNGDGIRAITFLNYDTKHTAAVEFQDIQEIAPGTFDIEKRLSLEWKVSSGPPRCVPLTLIVTHASNADADHFPIDHEDVASITWWLSLNDPGATEVVCPVASKEKSP